MLRLRGYLSRSAAGTDQRGRFERDLPSASAYKCWVTRLKCPNYNCRQKGFESMESLSDHVSKCPPLLEASYWCESCGKREHLGVEEFWDGTIATDHADKRSKLKRAGDFLKRFRCPDCRIRSRRNHVVPAELEALPVYPHGMHEMDSNHDQAPSPGKHRLFGVSSPIVPESVLNVRYPDENGWDSQSPTRQEVEGSNSSHHGVSYPGSVTEHAHNSSHYNGNSQRSSRARLSRLSIPDKPPEMPPAVYIHKQGRVRNAMISKSGINESTQPSSSLIESSDSHPPQSDSSSSTTATRDPPDDFVISPLSPKSSQSDGQIQRDLASAMRPYSPSAPVELSAEQRISTTFHRSHNDISARYITKQKIPESDTTSVSQHSLNRDSALSFDSPPTRRDLKKASQQNGNESAPNQPSTVEHQSPLPTSRVTLEPAITGRIYRTLREASLIWHVDVVGDVADYPGQQTIEAQLLSTRAQVEHLHKLLCGSKDECKGYSDNWSETSSVLAGRNTSSLLNDGLEALAQYFSGDTPTTLAGVLALLQFADACACTCHHRQTPLTRISFYQNALRWADKIKDLHEREHFIKIVHRLGGDSCHYPHHTSDLEDALRYGTVIVSCVSFLDGMIYY